MLLIYVGLVCGFERWFNLPHLEASWLYSIKRRGSFHLVLMLVLASWWWQQRVWVLLVLHKVIGEICYVDVDEVTWCSSVIAYLRFGFTSSEMFFCQVPACYKKCRYRTAGLTLSYFFLSFWNSVFCMKCPGVKLYLWVPNVLTFTTEAAARGESSGILKCPKKMGYSSFNFITLWSQM